MEYGDWAAQATLAEPSQAGQRDVEFLSPVGKRRAKKRTIFGKLDAVARS
jgi:hypothetical protein